MSKVVGKDVGGEIEKVPLSGHFIGQDTDDMSLDDKEVCIINWNTIGSLSKLTSQQISPINVMMWYLQDM